MEQERITNEMHKLKKIEYPFNDLFVCFLYCLKFHIFYK